MAPTYVCIVPVLRLESYWTPHPPSHLPPFPPSLVSPGHSPLPSPSQTQNREEEPGREPRITHRPWLTSFEGLLWCKKSARYIGWSIHKLLDCFCKKEETNRNYYILYLDRIAWHYMNNNLPQCVRISGDPAGATARASPKYIHTFRALSCPTSHHTTTV